MKSADTTLVHETRSDRTLDRENIRFQGILDLATDAIVSVNEDNVITLFNRGAEKIFGHDRQEVIGKSLDVLLPDRFHAAHHEHMKQFARSSQTSRVMGDRKEVLGRRKDGSEFVAEASISHLDLEDETVFTVILRDISDRIRAQQKLEQTAEELRRSNAELEQFAYIASHDLQEPLRMVSSYCQLLSKRYAGKLDADADEFIEFAMDGAERMRNLINDLLAYSRVGARGSAISTTDPADAVTAACNNLSASIEESGATVSCDDLPMVSADPSQLVMLFQNLIGNALKYRGDAAPTVEISAKPEGNEWVFSASDNGIGIEPQYFDRIFGIFQRLHSQKEYGGTGIGLSLCKKIVERHGGRIWVASRPGKGSVFYFTLPTIDPVTSA